MKKIFRFFLLFVGLFAINGCNNTVTVSNNSEVVYKAVNSKDDLIYNVRESLENIKGVNFNGVLTIKDKSYNFDGKVIVGETIEDSIINVNNEKNSLYVKNGKVYVSYRYNNTNVIVKDTIETFVKEACDILHSKDKKCNESLILEIIKQKTLDDIDYGRLIDKVFVSNNEIDYKGFKTTLSSDYRIMKISYANKDVSVDVNINYDKVSINIPLGYDLITMKVKSIKELLRLNNIADLIK